MLTEFQRLLVHGLMRVCACMCAHRHWSVSTFLEEGGSLISLELTSYTRLPASKPWGSSCFSFPVPSGTATLMVCCGFWSWNKGPHSCKAL